MMPYLLILVLAYPHERLHVLGLALWLRPGHDQRLPAGPVQQGHLSGFTGMQDLLLSMLIAVSAP
uniref:hypothetical protein n=1 Tax=Aeromonas salmonicida TaxID=645 RepID=UPI00215B679A|nr:hypothetical protein [Aeromonas salmonicida]